jgi:hypothetical protein
MKNITLSVLIVFISLLFNSCAGKKSEAASIAEKWCDLKAKVHSTSNYIENQKAREALSRFADEIENKYKSNQQFMNEIYMEMEKCNVSS